jgi:hypothetical protein
MVQNRGHYPVAIYPYFTQPFLARPLFLLEHKRASNEDDCIRMQHSEGNLETVQDQFHVPVSITGELVRRSFFVDGRRRYRQIRTH